MKQQAIELSPHISSYKLRDHLVEMTEKGYRVETMERVSEITYPLSDNEPVAQWLIIYDTSEVVDE